MSHLKRHPIKAKGPIKCQILEWQDEDVEYTYSIKLFGVTEKGYSICITVPDYKPYFYIKVPKNWGVSKKKKFIDSLKDKMGWKVNIVEDECKILEKKDFFGFTNGEKQRFIKLVFNNLSSFYTVRKELNNKFEMEGKKLLLQQYESNLDPILRFCHDKNIQTAGWIEIDKYMNNDIANTQIDIEASMKSIKFIDKKDISKIRQASFDIECYSHDGSFPNPKIKENVLYQIATTFKTYGESDCFYKNILTLKDCPEITDANGIPTEVKCFDNEADLLMAWKELLVEYDPDILYQYNGDRFDGKYIGERVILNDIEEEFYNGLGKFKETEDDNWASKKRWGKIKQDRFSSGAYGTTDYDRLVIPGRINFDVLIFINREYKLESYKLDDVAERYLKQKKNPVTPQQIFNYYADGSPDKIKTIAEYCLQDTILPQKLVDKLDILPIQIEMAKVTYVPIRYLIERGQQIKVFSQIARRTKEKGYLIPVLKEKECGVKYTNDKGKIVICREKAKYGYEIKGEDGGEIVEERCEKHKEEGMSCIPKFKGATVLEPLKGAYFEPITTLDFASLYPSIIRAEDMCYTSFVNDPKYDELEGVKYNTIEWDEEQDDGTIRHNCYKFAEDCDTILPPLLTDLYKERKAVKKLMNTETDPFKKSVYNAQQLAIKVSMNSVYGFLAANMLKCKPIAASVTAKGRQMIDNTKEYVESNYPGAVCVYGDTDSVFVKFKTPSGDKYKELYMNLKDKKVLDPEEDKKLKELKDKSMEESFELGKRASEEVTNALFKKPNLLEFEKVYNPLLLFGKKMYIAALHETSPYKPDYIDKKGVALKRRDNCHLLKDTYNHVVNLVMEKGERGLDESFVYLDNVIDDIINNRIPFEKLVITKTYKTGYKTENIPHKILAEKMYDRDPGSAPRINERVAFMFVQHPNKKAKLYEKVEDPEYAKKHDLKPDMLYYLENQLKNPLIQFYSDLVGPAFINNYFKEKIRMIQNKSPKQKKCEAIYKSGVKKGTQCSQDAIYGKRFCGRHSKQETSMWFEI